MMPPVTQTPEHPKVSVLVLTYKHGKFIEQCLQSILNQKVQFSYEIVVGEDGSPDETAVICERYQRMYPDKIRLFRRSRKDLISICGRITGRRNLIESWKSCRGEFVALLEGDDYWIDEDKLRKQVEFLDRNTDFTLCGTNVEFRGEDLGFRHLKYPQGTERTLELVDFLQERTILATGSAMIRRSAISEFPDWFYTSFSGDWGLFIQACWNGGKAKLLPDVTAVYRQHHGGLNTGANVLWRVELIRSSYAAIENKVAPECQKLIKRKMAGLNARLVFQYIKSGQIRRGVKSAFACVFPPSNMLHMMIAVPSILFARLTSDQTKL